jgi:hypothetical protein
MVIFGHSDNDDMDFRNDTVDDADLLNAMDMHESYFANVDKTLTENKESASFEQG